MKRHWIALTFVLWVAPVLFAGATQQTVHPSVMDAIIDSISAPNTADKLTEGTQAASMPTETSSDIRFPSWKSLTSPERLTGNIQLMAVMAAQALLN